MGLKLDSASSVGVQYFDDFVLVESSVSVAAVGVKGFESSVDGFSATSLSSIATTTAQARTGTRSLQVTPTGAGWNITDTAGVAVTAGGQYQLTGWARRVGWGTFFIEAEWRNASNTVIATSTIGEPDMGEVWRPFATANLTAPVGATQLRVRFGGWTTDTWWFDDITITAITAPAATTTVLTERRYYQLDGISIGTRTRDTVANIDVYHYLLGDIRGSTSLAVQRGTTTVQTQWYTPYGAPRGTPTITATDRGYIGQYDDTTTGLNYLNHRHHDPQTGVFLSVDPLVTTTREPYLYGSGNPTTLADPSGLMPDGFSSLDVSHNEFGGWTIGSWNSRYETNWRNQIVYGWDRDNGQMSFPAGSMQANVARQRGACYDSHQPFMCMAAAFTGMGNDPQSSESVALKLAWFRDATVGGHSWVDSGYVATDPLFDMMQDTILTMGFASATRGLLALFGVSQGTAAIGHTGMALSRARGIAGEAMAGDYLGFSAGGSSFIGASGRMRFPDFLDDAVGLIADSKNVAYLSYTSQLRDYAAFAQSQGWGPAIVFVRQNTVTSAPLDRAVEAGSITLIRLFPAV